jgi:hypothetical protein
MSAMVFHSHLNSLPLAITHVTRAFPVDKDGKRSGHP